MFFRKYYSFSSTKNVAEIKKNLLGQHLKVHDLDFEIFEKNNSLKIIPHTEFSERSIYTLPITKLTFKENNGKVTINMMSKPRRIDVGGPNILMIFILFALITAIILYVKGGEGYYKVVYVIFAVALSIFALFWFRLHQGYFDYIRKIRNWVKSHI